MRMPVKYYSGEEITDDVIARAREIVKKSNNSWLFTVYDETTTLEDLCMWHYSCPEEENMVLGEDWLIAYSHLVGEEEIVLTQWACVEGKKEKFSQTMEMMMAMKKIFLSSGGVHLYADMRHDTAYKFYESLLKRGYLEEYSNSIEIDDFCSEKLARTVRGILDEYSSLDAYFEKCGYDSFPERYQKVLFHSVCFGVTEKFVKQYKR